jgi:prepilin-type N-terminal cleavage/methylation domain-containing protein
VAAPARAGFTLIEIVLVLAVLAIASVIAFPALQPALEATRAEGAARRAAAFLDDVRRRSVLGRVELEVGCSPREGRLVLRGGAAGAREFRLPEGMTLVSCRPDRLRYFPQGSSTGMALLLRDRRGRERRIAVGAFTGLAAIVEAP